MLPRGHWTPAPSLPFSLSHSFTHSLPYTHSFNSNLQQLHLSERRYRNTGICYSLTPAGMWILLLTLTFGLVASSWANSVQGKKKADLLIKVIYCVLIFFLNHFIYVYVFIGLNKINCFFCKKMNVIVMCFLLLLEVFSLNVRANVCGCKYTDAGEAACVSCGRQSRQRRRLPTLQTDREREIWRDIDRCRE